MKMSKRVEGGGGEQAVVKKKRMKQAKDRTVDKEQFYTCSTVAKQIIEHFINREAQAWSQIRHVIEPSAGNGVFVRALTAVAAKNHHHHDEYHGHGEERLILAFDIDPSLSSSSESEAAEAGDVNIVQCDFLALTTLPISPPDIVTRETLCIGNPPFGIRGALARKFLNKCAEFSDYILMILPLSFKSDQMLNGVNKNFHLMWSLDLPSDLWTTPDGAPVKRNIQTAAFFFQRQSTIRAAVPRVTFESVNEMAVQSGWKLMSTKTSNKTTSDLKMANLERNDIGIFLWNTTVVDFIVNIANFNTERFHVVRLLTKVPTKEDLDIIRGEYIKVRAEKEGRSTLKGMIAIALPDLLEIMNESMTIINNK